MLLLTRGASAVLEALPTLQHHQPGPHAAPVQYHLVLTKTSGMHAAKYHSLKAVKSFQVGRYKHLIDAVVFDELYATPVELS